jgi:hypothetical protein
MLKHYIEQLLAVWSIIRQISKCRNSIAELLMSDFKQFQKIEDWQNFNALNYSAK